MLSYPKGLDLLLSARPSTASKQQLLLSPIYRDCPPRTKSFNFNMTKALQNHLAEDIKMHAVTRCS